MRLTGVIFKTLGHSSEQFGEFEACDEELLSARCCAAGQRNLRPFDPKCLGKDDHEGLVGFPLLRGLSDRHFQPSGMGTRNTVLPGAGVRLHREDDALAGFFEFNHGIGDSNTEMMMHDVLSHGPPPVGFVLLPVGLGSVESLEQSAADADERGPLFYGDHEVVAHAHRELRQR